VAIPILKRWRSYFEDSPHEGLGSSYERVILNLKLEGLRQKYQITTCLEVPVFGFTGLSGINSLDLAKKGVQVTVVDNHQDRLRLIEDAWKRVGARFSGTCVKEFSPLSFGDKVFDMSWNFSAMWFVDDIHNFLKELTRITQKVIFICVPNRLGMGFLSQKYISGAELREELKEEYIIPKNICSLMLLFGWKLVEKGYIDAPPWPDIGMKKEEFLKLFGLGSMLKKREESAQQPLTIMDYYGGNDPKFPEKMLRHYWFEQKAPRFVKALWAHHRYLLFEPAEKNGTE
jgi:SAM-dependent methyltransferase